MNHITLPGEIHPWSRVAFNLKRWLGSELLIKRAIVYTLKVWLTIIFVAPALVILEEVLFEHIHNPFDAYPTMLLLEALIFAPAFFLVALITAWVNNSPLSLTKRRTRISVAVLVIMCGSLLGVAVITGEISNDVSGTVTGCVLLAVCCLISARLYKIKAVSDTAATSPGTSLV